MIDKHKLHVEELIKNGIFHITDLEVNRSGHLSIRQKRILYLNLAFWLMLTVFDITILSFFIYLLIMFQRNFVAGIIWSILMITPAYMCIINAKPYWKDIQEDMPSTVSRKIYKHASIGPGVGTAGDGGIYGIRRQVGYCNIRIEDQIFSISPSIYDHIIHEGKYRVYFVSNSRKSINIEPL